MVSTVFFDVDTQLDFLSPAGALHVPGAEKLAPALAALTRHAVRSGIPIVATADAHTADDPEFETWRPHCVAGTQGQQKCSATTVSESRVIDGSFEFEWLSAPQIIIEKQTLDPFSNPILVRVLDLLDAQRYVVYGLVTEYCVRFSALGLLKRGTRVELVTDAIKSLNAVGERDTIERFRRDGGTLTTVAEVLGSTLR